MENINKSEVSAALKKALADEHLWSRDAAKLLNMNPIYISFMLNPKSFDKCGSTAWTRAYEWFLTKEPLASFKFPAEEAVWQPKKQEPNIEGSGMETIPALKKDKKEKKEKKEKPFKAKKGEEEKQPEPEQPEPEQPKPEQPKPEQSHQPEKLNPEIIGTLDKVIGEKVEQILIEGLERLAPRIIERHIPTGTVELKVPDNIHQRMSLDIEINLILNGQRIRIS